MRIFFSILTSVLAFSASAQVAGLPMISSEQLQVGNQWTWNYFEQGDATKLYSTERYTIVARNKDILTLELWTLLAGSAQYTPSARFVVNLQDCWSAFKTPVKRVFQITTHSYEKNKWSIEGYKIPATAFEEKFNCNPYLYSAESQNYETILSTEPTQWGALLTFQQKPKRNSQLQSFYFADHPVLKAVAYRKRFNPVSPYEFEMILSHFETNIFSPRP